MDKLNRQALEIGHANAGEVISFRRKALRRKAEELATRAAVASQEIDGPAAVETSKTSGTLVAEGDSWFDYPWTDI